MERGLDEFVKFVDLCETTLFVAEGRERPGEPDCSDYWNKNLLEIHENWVSSKFNVLHFVIVESNERVIEFVKDKLSRLDHRIGVFRSEREGYRDESTISIVNDDKKIWLFSMSSMVINYEVWFAELIGHKNNETQKTTSVEEHIKIFKRNGFRLFDHLMTNHTTGAVKTDIGYFYRRMEADYLKVGEAEFRRWIKTVYDIEISKIKNDLDNMETHYKVREDNYKIGLEWFKSQSTLQNKIGTKRE